MGKVNPSGTITFAKDASLGTIVHEFLHFRQLLANNLWRNSSLVDDAFVEISEFQVRAVMRHFGFEIGEEEFKKYAINALKNGF